MSRIVLWILSVLFACNDDDALLIFRVDEFIGSIVFYALTYVSLIVLHSSPVSLL